MWFIYATIHVFLMSVVNFTDEHLATNNKLPKKSDVHTKVGSVLIASTLMCFVGAFLLYLFTRDTHLTTTPLLISLASSITMVITWAVYFYFLQTYPVHQVVPLFQLSSVWLLVIELLFGGSIAITGLLGILLIMYGAYIFDTGTFKWQIPTKLLLIAIPSMSTWAISLFLVKKASEMGSPVAIYFWQLVATGIIGILLFGLVSKYREGFVYRIKHQGKKFLSLSLLNETFSEASFLFSSLAVAVAPVAAYVSVMGGAQGLFELLLFLLFPQGERVKVTKMQWAAAIFIALGVFLIEIK